MAIIPYVIRVNLVNADKERSIAKKLYFTLHYYFLKETNGLDDSNIITKLLSIGILFSELPELDKEKKFVMAKSMIEKGQISNEMSSITALLEKMPEMQFKLIYQEIQNMEEKINRCFSWDNIDIISRGVFTELCQF